jgi:bifunctional DNase/RNase
MDKIKLNVLGLSYSQTQSGAYALVLSEEEGERRMPIIIGGFEAQAIAIELEGLKPPRPLTHDLILNITQPFNVKLEEVVITKLVEGVFYSELILNNGKKKVVVDARTSDAVALALRFGCPIFTSEEILSKAGIVLDADREITEQEETFVEKKEEKIPNNPYASLSIEELEKALSNAITNEQYETASLLKKELDSRKGV